jgi:hypothetical protein
MIAPNISEPQQFLIGIPWLATLPGSSELDLPLGWVAATLPQD